MMVEYDPQADELKHIANEEKRYAQIVKRFRIIQPDEVNKMIQDSLNPMANKDKHLTPSKKQLLQGGMSPMDLEGSKKRSREDMLAGAGPSGMPMNLQFSGEGTIEQMIHNLKQRVLNGETLNNFKKEIASISVLIDKSENQNMFEKSVYLLAQILQKGEKEISLMLKRNCLQEKKKKKKNDIDKKRLTIASLIERDLKDANSKKVQAEAALLEPGALPQYIMLSLDQLDPNNLVFIPSKEMVPMFNELKVHLEEFKNINNEYIQIKLQEEKIKNKKQKQTQPDEKEDVNGLSAVWSGGQKLEEITLQGEVDRTIKLLVDGLPEKIRENIHDRLMVTFEIRKMSEFPNLQQKMCAILNNGQRKGQRWNKVVSWY